jgi:hypothetical protein
MSMPNYFCILVYRKELPTKLFDNAEDESMLSAMKMKMFLAVYAGLAVLL